MNSSSQREFLIAGLEKLLGSQRLALLEYFLRPNLKKSWGGPFNGQLFRQQIYLDLLDTCRFKAIVETGTFRGTTTTFLAESSSLPIFTVESQPRFYYYATRRLRKLAPQITIELAASTDFLEKLASSSQIAKERVFLPKGTSRTAAGLALTPPAPLSQLWERGEVQEKIPPLPKLGEGVRG